MQVKTLHLHRGFMYTFDQLMVRQPEIEKSKRTAQIDN